MSVWLTIPSARPPAEAEPILAKWRQQGYRIALWRDGQEAWSFPDFCYQSEIYPGYAKAVNFLVSVVMERDPSCEWFVTGGDDVEPDMNHSAQEIAAQCSGYFYQSTFGVMQPTGDRFDGGCIDRICGSPWMGREWCRRINQGRGPLWPEYTHMFVDEELQNVAIKYGVLWQRPDLIHLHHHFMRASTDLHSRAVAVSEGGKILYGARQLPRPAFLDEANSGAHWSKYKGIFLERKRAGFRGSEPL
jgi:hypothetical protein